VATVTALIVTLSFVAGCITAVVGVWVGRGTSPVSLLLNWGALTLVLQLFATCIAVVHARADRARAPGSPPAHRTGTTADLPRDAG